MGNKSLNTTYAFLKMLIVFLQFLIPLFIVFFYNHRINPWYILAGTILYVIGSRIVWVLFDLRSSVFHIVCDKMRKEKAEVLTSIFR